MFSSYHLVHHICSVTQKNTDPRFKSRYKCTHNCTICTKVLYHSSIFTNCECFCFYFIRLFDYLQLKGEFIFQSTNHRPVLKKKKLCPYPPFMSRLSLTSLLSLFLFLSPAECSLLSGCDNHSDLK